MDDTVIFSARNYEEKVVSIIAHLLDADEDIELCHNIGVGGLMADVFLENGAKKLNLPPKSLIEIKYLLRNDTLSRIALIYKRVIDERGYAKLIIICKDNLTDRFINKVGLPGRFEIWTFEELEFKAHRIDSNGQNVSKPGLKKVPSPDIVKRASNAAANDKVSLFLGAGVSMDAKLPSWNKLLAALLTKIKNRPFEYINEANTESISDYLSDSSIITGRYIMDGYRVAIKRLYEETREGNKDDAKIEENIRTEIVDRMRKALYKDIDNVNKSSLVKVIASIARKSNVVQIITYNYDDLIETDLSDSARFKPVYDQTIDRLNGFKPIYHVHGYIPRNEKNPGFPTLSEKEYHKLYSRTHQWSNVVQLNALYSTTCFFIGFSMSDPNQRRLLDLARNVDLGSTEAGRAQHYIFLRRQNLKGEASSAVNDEHFREIENMMFELGLNVIWFDEFEKLPQYLLYIFGKANDRPKMKF